jgi:hypothetical protein
MIVIDDLGREIAKYTAKELRGMFKDELWGAMQGILDLPRNPYNFDRLYSANARTYNKVKNELLKRI